MLSITEAVMAAEMPAITAWVERRHWDLTYDEAAMKGRAVAKHPHVEDQEVTFWFDVEGYPNIQPPAWWCGGDGQAVSIDHVDYPRPRQNPPPPIGSIFHAKPVICAPWNRLAYALHGGPHEVNDWPTLSAWKTNGPGYTQANTIADMLSALDLHLQYSDGMQP